MKKQFFLFILLTNILFVQAQIATRQKIKNVSTLSKLSQVPAKLSNCGSYYGPAIKNEVNGIETDENIIVNTCNSWTDKQSKDGGSSIKKSWVFWNKYAIAVSFIFHSGYKLEDGKYKFLINNITLQPNECKDLLTVQHIGYENITNDKNYYFITNFKGIL